MNSIKQLHDSLIGVFSQGHSRLLAFMYHIRDLHVKSDQPIMCLWAIRSPDPDDSDSVQLAILNRNMPGPVPSNIHFRSTEMRECFQVVVKINKTLFGLSHDQAMEIYRVNQRRAEQKRRELYNKALVKILGAMPPEKLLSIPGAYEAISEELNNPACDIVERYQANPSFENIDLKYNTREILEMAIDDLKRLRQKIYGHPKIHNRLQDNGMNFISMEQTIQLAENHLETMDKMLNGDELI